MKKIIAISVMFVLIAGAAFADTSVGGNLRLGADLAKDKGTGDDVRAGEIWFNDINTKVEWSGDNAGGLMKLHSFKTKDGTPQGSFWIPNYFAFVWWKPMDALKVQFGQNADGEWGHAQITGWGFNAEAQASVAMDQDSKGYQLNKYTANIARTCGAWWGGFNAFGTYITISPMPGFDINLGIPMDAEKDLASFYSNTKINFKYDLPDIGTIRLAADLKKANKDADLIPNIYFAFYLSAIEGMGIELGVGSFQSDGGTEKDGKPTKNDALAVGIGYSLSADDLGFKARLGFIPQMGKQQGEAAKGMLLGLEILPSYNLGSLTVFVNAGFGTAFGLPEGAKASYFTDFYFNPYIAVPLNAGKFYAGIKFGQQAETSAGKPDAVWSIPIGWNVYF